MFGLRYWNPQKPFLSVGSSPFGWSLPLDSSEGFCPPLPRLLEVTAPGFSIASPSPSTLDVLLLITGKPPPLPAATSVGRAVAGVAPCWESLSDLGELSWMAGAYLAQ